MPGTGVLTEKFWQIFVQRLALCAGMSYFGAGFKNIWGCENMILCDKDLRQMLPKLIPNESERDESLVNPASIDIRVGRDLLREGRWGNFCDNDDPDDVVLCPGEFVLVSTFERIHVPNGYALDLRLKSSTARQGFDHSLAFWVDPGWDGYLTMEVRNTLRFGRLLLKPGMRFAQIIVHKLTGEAEKPYSGKYQGAKGAEGAKK